MMRVAKSAFVGCALNFRVGMLLKGAVKVIFLLLVERNETADSDTILDVQIILFTSVLFIK